MSLSNHVAVTAGHAVASVPAYCNNSLTHKPLTPAQWQACWNAGWNQSTTGAAHAGAAAVGPASVAFLVLIVVIAIAVRWKAAGSAAPRLR